MIKITQLYEHVVCLYVENFFTTNDHFSGPTASAIIKKDHKQVNCLNGKDNKCYKKFFYLDTGFFLGIQKPIQK